MRIPFWLIWWSFLSPSCLSKDLRHQTHRID
jgi:hypothetical protein